MDAKQFRQPTVREAIRAVRNELGADALVLNSEMVPARGWRGWLGVREVRVTAMPPPATRERRPAVTPRRQPDHEHGPDWDGLVARLTAGGLDRATAEAVATSVPPDERRKASIDTLRAALAMYVADVPAGDEPPAPIEVFVGPPGVGKTTTIAKIAAQARARRGHRIGLVAADAFRAGAVEHLRAYASIIGAPFRVARSRDELDVALSNRRHPLLVDTAGRSPSDLAMRDLRRLVSRCKGARTHLVLAADTSVATARRVIAAYDEVMPQRCVITKVDEAATIAPLLGALRDRGLPVSYLTTGQSVPEDLETATPAVLAAALLPDSRSGWAGV